MPLPEEYLRKSLRDQKIALMRALMEYRKHPPEIRKQRARLKLIETTCNTVLMWVPFIEGRLLGGLAVTLEPQRPLHRRMQREEYVWLLEKRLRHLVQRDWRRAKDLLAGSPEHNPDLYTIALWTPMKEWAAQLVRCDQMYMRLNQIDWEISEYASVPYSEIPGLGVFVESV